MTIHFQGRPSRPKASKARRRGSARGTRSSAAGDVWQHRRIPSALFVAGIVRRLYVPSTAHAAIAADVHDDRVARLYVLTASPADPVQ